MSDEFERLHKEICGRPFAASDIGWHCTIAESGTDPESVFVEPLWRFHPTDSRVAFLGFIKGVVVVHRLWWSEVNDVRLLDEFARHLVKPGHGQPYRPPINREVSYAMLPGPVGLLDGRTFDWIWVAVFLDWLAEQDLGFVGVRHSTEVAPNEQGVLDAVAGGRKTLFTERLLQVIAEIDFVSLGVLKKPWEPTKGEAYVIVSKKEAADACGVSTKVLTQRITERVYDGREINRKTVEINQKHLLNRSD